MAKRVLCTRNDGRLAWRLEADGGLVIAADAGAGCASESEARDMADKIIGGHFKDALGDIAPSGPTPGQEAVLLRRRGPRVRGPFRGAGLSGTLGRR